MQKKVTIQGMNCASCASKIEKAVSQLNTVHEAKVNLLTHQLLVDLKDDTAMGEVLEAVKEAGYAVEDVLHTDLLAIDGMRCASCANKVEEKVAELDFVVDATVNFATEKLYVTYAKEETLAHIVSLIHELGYQVRDKQTVKKDNQLEQKKSVIGTFICLIPLLYLSMGHMFGLPIPHILHQPFFMAITQLILSMPIVWLNRRYYKSGFKQLRSGTPNMDSLVALGTSAAFMQGILVAIFSLFDHHIPIYVESGAVILALITLGKYIETLAKGKTTAAIQTLVDMAPSMANRIVDGKEEVVLVDMVKVGDLLVSKAGERIVLDGEIESGDAQIDESMMTGESMPVKKAEKDEVYAGTLNENGVIYYRVTKVSQDTVLSQMIQLVEESMGHKVPIAKLADKISGYFVPIILCLALLTFGGWLLAGYSFTFALNTAISVLVIACPCALGLATPTAIMVSTGKGAEQGILVKNGEALETAHHLQTIIMDKTGTITLGKPTVTDIFTVLPKEEFITLIVSLENLSTHPLAKAIIELGNQQESVSDFQLLEGLGVQGIVNQKKVFIGNAKGLDISAYEQDVTSLSNEGKTVVFVVVDDTLVGYVAIADAVKSSSEMAIATLKQQGIDVVMLTGDDEKTARAIASKVGIQEVISQVLPQEKAAIVRKYQENGKIVAMVGDGINDAAALAQADVGVAIGNGTQVAIESADIVLMHNDLRDVAKMIQLSRRTLHIIKQNLFWAFAYNVIGIPIAMGLFFLPFGLLLDPMLAGLAMGFSSVSVVLNALRLKQIKWIGEA